MNKYAVKRIALWAGLIAFHPAAIAQDTCIKGDCENGYGELKCDCGYLYKGEFRNGKKTRGTLYKEDLHYTGTFQHDMPWGEGAIYFADSSSYRGEFSGAAPHGFGKYYLPAGKMYKGMLIEGDFNGFGIKFQDSNNLSHYYAGTFDNDIKNGFGIEKAGDSITLGYYKKGNFKYGLVVVKPSQEEMTAVRSGKGSDQKNLRYEIAEDYIWVRFEREKVDLFLRESVFAEMTLTDEIHRIFIDRETPPRSTGRP